jgi:hypothetical protein
LRELTRYRIKLVRMRSSGKAQVHAVLAKPGIPVTCSDLFGAWGLAWLDGLDVPQPYAGKVASLRELISWLSAEIGLLDAVIADLLGSCRCPRDGWRTGLGSQAGTFASDPLRRHPACAMVVVVFVDECSAHWAASSSRRPTWNECCGQHSAYWSRQYIGGCRGCRQRYRQSGRDPLS